MAPCHFLSQRKLCVSEPAASPFVKIFIQGRYQLALIDTGAAASFLPATTGTPTTRKFVSVDGKHLNAFEAAEYEFAIGTQLVKWEFYGANIQNVILGADFLRHYNLVINFKKHAILSKSSGIFSPFVDRECESQIEITAHTAEQLFDVGR